MKIYQLLKDSGYGDSIREMFSKLSFGSNGIHLCFHPEKLWATLFRKQ